VKVLMFGWEFPPHISGGLGTACFGLTSGLLQQGAEVTFVVPKLFGDEDKSKFRFVSASEVEMEFTDKRYFNMIKQMKYFEVSSTLIPYMGPEQFQSEYTHTDHSFGSSTETFSSHFEFTGHYGKDLMQEVARYAIVASEIARKQQFDVIHSHDWLTIPAGLLAKRVSGKPLVVHIHATEYDRSGEHINHDVYNIEKEGLEKADAIIAVSGFTKKIIVEKYGISPDKITVVHNAILPQAKKVRREVPAKKERVVTFLGRITFQKGPEYFVEAARKVLKRYPDVRFVMAGTGDMMPKMIRLVAKSRIGSHFHFTGFLKGEEKDYVYSMSDVYVMPSVSEPFGIAPLEAMRSGVPVIISKQSGVAEVLQNAIKVDFWDVDAIADAIAGILTYKPLSRTFIKNGRLELENMQWSKAANNVINIYKKMTNKSTV
jgi:glycosyltransferase involved in cell wall biosynthesis